MKIIVIGATGIIGSAVADALASEHEVVRASRRGDPAVDIADPASVEELFAKVGNVDAVVCCAASGQLAPLTTATDAEFFTGLDDKLLGQVRLARTAAAHLADGGSITITSGAIPKSLPGAAFGALTNAGLDAFVAAAADELPRGLRINAVSPGWVSETLEKLGMDPTEGTPVSKVARAYVDIVNGTAQGLSVRPLCRAWR